MDNDEVLVIGGGVIGICAAYYLTAHGYSVTIIERDQVGAGSSYGNAGLVVPSHAIPLAAPGVFRQGLKWLLDPESPLYIQPRADLDLIRWLWRFLLASREQPFQRAISVFAPMSFASLKLYEELAGSLSFGFERRGGLYLFTSRQSLEKSAEEIHLLQPYGVEVQVLDAEGVRKLQPQLSLAVVGGIYYPQDAHLIPDRFVRTLAECVKERGVRVETSTEVLGFEVTNSAISSVITTRGTFRPGQVVLAAGAWSPVVARDLHIRLPIQAAKGYSVTVKRPSPGPDIPLHLSERKIVLTPMGDTLRLAGTLELAGLNLTINRRRVAAIQRSIHEYLPQLPDTPLVEVWRGLRPLTPDTLPIIGRVPHVKNLVLSTGHGMLGMSLGPITGKLVSQIVVAEPPTVDVSPFRLERFSS